MRLPISVCAMLAGSALLGQDVVSTQQLGVSTREQAEALQGHYFVYFKAGATRNERSAAALGAGATVRKNFDVLNALAVVAPNANALNALRGNSRVERIAPVYRVRAQIEGRPAEAAKKPPQPPPPPAPATTQQIESYEVQRVGRPVMGTSDGSGFGIAVIDTGIDFSHPDLSPAGNNASTAFNAITETGGNCSDDGGHGTHVTGLFAALNNNQGMLGIAPAAKPYCIKALAGNLTGDEADVVSGLDWVLRNANSVTPRIKVVNLSLGRPLAVGENIETTPMLPLIRALYNAGIIVVVSAGNERTLDVREMVPAGYAEVIAVASTTATAGVRACNTYPFDTIGYVRADSASIFTTDGAWDGTRGVTISAPGEERNDIVPLGYSCVALLYGSLSTTANTGGVTRKIVSQAGILEARGTSFAAPLVAGVVSRVLQKGLVSLTPGDGTLTERIRSWLRANADRVGSAPFDHTMCPVEGCASDSEREGVAQGPQ